MSDSVKHPSHYNSGKIEMIEFVEDQKLGFNLGNAIKYTARAGKKDPSKHVEDLEKACWYLRREIELVLAARENRDPCRPNDMDQKTRPPKLDREILGRAFDATDTYPPKTKPTKENADCSPKQPSVCSRNGHDWGYAGDRGVQCDRCGEFQDHGAFRTSVVRK